MFLCNTVLSNQVSSRPFFFFGHILRDDKGIDECMTLGWENLEFGSNKILHNSLGNVKCELDQSQFCIAVNKMMYLEAKISGKHISIWQILPT